MVVGGKGTMWIKVIAVLLGVATMTVMQNGLGIEWYWALPIGMLAYFLGRYIGYAIRPPTSRTVAAGDALPIRRRHMEPGLGAAILPPCVGGLNFERVSKPFYAVPMSSADCAYSAALVGFAMMVRSARS